MRRSQLIPAAIAGAALVGGLAAPAAADSATRRDPSGDAPARIDITKVRYSHLSDRVRVSAKIPELGRSGTAELTVSQYEIFEAGYIVRIRKHRGEKARVALLYFDHFDVKKQKCRGVSGTWGEQVIRLKVPRSCLKKRGHATEELTLQLFTSFGTTGEQVDEAPQATSLPRS
ncbi:hypothetical protein AFL01nite_00400 [Aeromicrobium flavum]|uniref:Uncharacterized protein n=1 Tax=Aeromicrobium flavum TaxID=416568 RepID=A0A512HQH7_9ACTN|nr:hypothetical protein [Aeromicrobium flavum]GEO87713.1 hypothetical protein AFL01nite_00400 [Aeromicrobium flavum]